MQEDNNSPNQTGTEQSEPQTATNQEAQPKKSFKDKLTKRNLIVAVAVLGLVLIGAWGFIASTTDSEPAADGDLALTTVPSQGAAVTYAEGRVEYGNGQFWQEALSGTQPQAGDHIRTGELSRAIIAFDDGSAIRLNADSEVKLEQVDTENIQIVNLSGEVYSRVTPSESREFSVTADGHDYLALGTAFLTSNTKEKAGTEVYHSKVAVDEDTEVDESEAFYTKHSNKKSVDKVTKIDLKQLKKNEFVAWNSEQDKKQTEFADKLGILSVFEEPDEEPKDDEPSDETEPASNASLSLTAQATNKGVKLSWSVPSGVNSSDGFKIVKASGKTPVYGEHDSKFVGSDTTVFQWEITDGKSYNFRICTYKPDIGSCNNYSNQVTVKTNFVAPETVVNGAVVADLDGDKVSWTFEGTAPYGFKLLYNQAGNPEYGSAQSIFTSSTSKRMPTLDSGTYYVKVCKYTNNTESDKCVDYSNELIYDVD